MKKSFDLSSIGNVEPIKDEHLTPHTNNVDDRFLERVIISYSNFPSEAVELASNKAEEMGLTKKQFLWEAYRKMGVNLPEYAEVFRPYKKK